MSLISGNGVEVTSFFILFILILPLFHALPCIPTGPEILDNYVDDDCDGWINMRGYSIKRTRPRIWLTQNKIDQLNRSVIADSLSWEFYKNYIDARMTPGISLGYGVPPYAAALIYQLTGNASYCNKTIERVYTDYIDRYSPTLANVDYSGQIFDVAISYDWCYDLMNSTVRHDIESFTNQRMQALTTTGEWSYTEYIVNNRNIKLAYGECIPAYVFFEKNDNTTDFVLDCHTRLDSRVVGANLFMKGGQMSDMESYGPSTINQLLVSLFAKESATNLSGQFPVNLSQDRINYLLRMFVPKSRKVTSTSLSDDMLDTVKFGQTDLRSNYADEKRNLMILAENINSTNPALVSNLISYFNTYSILNDSQGSGFDEFFWDINHLNTAEDYTNLSLSWFADGAGIVVAKSDWTKNATSIAFKSGQRVNGHQDLDSNTFTIYSHGGDLILESGMYPSNTVDEHMRNYFARSIGSNTLLVYDPEEDSAGDSYDGDGIGIYRAWYNLHGEYPYYNDGGQRDFYCSSVFNTTYCNANYDLIARGAKSVYTYDHYVDNFDWKFDTGNVTTYEYNDDYVYAVGDARKAYRSTKMNSFKRSFIYLRNDTNHGEYIITFDKVNVTGRAQNFSKKIIFNTMYEPVGGSTYNSLEGDSSGGIKSYGNIDNVTITEYTGRLFVKSLLPKNKSIITVGGVPNINSTYLNDGYYNCTHWGTTIFRYNDPISEESRRGIYFRSKTDWYYSYMPIYADVNDESFVVYVNGSTDLNYSFNTYKNISSLCDAINSEENYSCSLYAGYQYYNDGENFYYLDTSPQRAQIRGEWRIEVESGDNKTYDNFFTVMQTGWNTTNSWSSVELVEDLQNEMYGTFLNDSFIVLFNKYDRECSQTQYVLDGEGVVNHLIVDLVPSTTFYIYDNSVLSKTQNSSSQGTLFFNTSLGSSHTYLVTTEEQGDQSPSVTLNLPVNGDSTTNTTVIFNCSATDDNNLHNITLYLNYSSWHANETVTLTGNLNSTVFIKKLPENQIYRWNCYVCDNESNCNWNMENYTLTISDAYLDADLNTDNIINTSEVRYYITEWMEGSVQLGGLSSVIDIWKNGGSY